MLRYKDHLKYWNIFQILSQIEENKNTNKEGLVSVTNKGQGLHINSTLNFDIKQYNVNRFCNYLHFDINSILFKYKHVSKILINNQLHSTIFEVYKIKTFYDS